MYICTLDRNKTWQYICDHNSQKTCLIFGRPFVKRFALCYQTVVCLSVCLSCPVLSVTLVYCGQTVGWIKMKLGMQIGLGPGYTVLDGDPAATIVHSAMHTHMNRLTVLWIGFCLTGPISLCQIHFCIVYYCVLYACLGL